MFVSEKRTVSIFIVPACRFCLEDGGGVFYVIGYILWKYVVLVLRLCSCTLTQFVQCLHPIAAVSRLPAYESGLLSSLFRLQLYFLPLNFHHRHLPCSSTSFVSHFCRHILRF
jgi:hypothetical protein